MPEGNSTPNTSDEQAITSPSNTASPQNSQSAPAAPIDSAQPQSQKPQPQKSPKPKNKLLPVVIILAILTLAGLGTSIYFGIHSSNQASEISDLKSELDSQKPSDQPSTPENPENPDDPNDNTNDVSQILAQVPGNLVIKSNDIAYSIGVSYTNSDMYAMSYRWSFYDNNGIMTIYWDNLADNFNPNNKTGAEEITAFGPAEGQVIDVVFGHFGNGSGNEAILFLMNDGTIEYVPYYLALKENNFRSRGKLENINGIIRLLDVNASNPNGVGGYRTVLAQRADGALYDLSSTINDLNILVTN